MSSYKIVPTITVRKLILLVKQYPALYQTDHRLYRNNSYKYDIWTKIAEALNCTQKHCRDKWRACRDQYARELKRYGKHIENSKWKFVNDLEFIRPWTLARVYKPRRSKLNKSLGDSSFSEMKFSEISDIVNDIKEEKQSESILSDESKFEQEIIDFIRSHDVLYNPNHRNYRKSEDKKKLWADLANKTHRSEIQCKSKWKGLRDQFSRETRHLLNCEDPDSVPKWRHYESLKFLDNSIRCKLKSIEKEKLKTEEIDDSTEYRSYTIEVISDYRELEEENLQQNITELIEEYNDPMMDAHESSYIEQLEDAELPIDIDLCESNINQASFTNENEVQAFFQALALKIVNANLSAENFMDLQIQVLQCISKCLKK